MGRTPAYRFIFHCILARSASDLLESTPKSQLDSAASTGSSCSSVFSATQLDEEGKDKLYPIPPRRTKKLKGRSRSSSAISSLEQAGSLLTTVFKRPLAGQRSNPELTRKVKPPRPPPPKRQIPPRSYVHPTSKSNQAKGTTALGGDKHPSLVVDSRAQRRPRNNRSPQPERPPLPYETCVPQKKQPINHTSTDSSRQDHTKDHSINGSVTAAMRHRVQREEDEIRVLVTPPPADYEVVVPSNVRKSSGNIPTISEGSTSTSFHDHPFPGPVVRRKVPKVVTGGGDNKVHNLANGRNTEHRESVAVPYELPTHTKTKGEEITTEEASVKDSATASNSETGHAKQQTDQGNGGRTFQGDHCIQSACI